MQNINQGYIENAHQTVSQLINNITTLVSSGEANEEFEVFLTILHQNVSGNITRNQAIEMLAQHIIIRPIFDTLYKEYHFTRNNNVSKYIQHIIEIIETNIDKQPCTQKIRKHLLEIFSPQNGNLDNHAKQHYGMLKSIFNSDNQHYSPQTDINADEMLINVKKVLNQHFNTDFNSQKVQIINPIAGSGEIITALFNNNFINQENALRKFKEEIFCSNINLLDYYIADLNIEYTFHKYMPQLPYTFFNGIKLYDPFFNSDSSFDFINDTTSAFNPSSIKVVLCALPENLDYQISSYPDLELQIKETFGNLPINNFTLIVQKAIDLLTNYPSGGVLSLVGNTDFIKNEEYGDMIAHLTSEQSQPIITKYSITFWKK